MRIQNRTTEKRGLGGYEKISESEIGRKREGQRYRQSVSESGEDNEIKRSI